MKAVVSTKYGPPDVLRLKRVAKPIPKDNEVLIKIHATTVNRTDCGFLKAKPFFARLMIGLIKPRNTILGNEYAGVIEAIGKNVTSFKVGSKVFGFDGDNFGAHAEYVAKTQDSVLTTVPKNMSFKEVAPSNEGAHYALNDIRKANVQRGQRVLVNGGSGGIGSAAVQLLKYYGTKVTTVANTKNLTLMKQLGAEKVFDYTKEDFTKDTQKYDFVFDSVGKSTYGRCKSLLKPGGVFISTELGYLAQNPVLAIITALFGSLPTQAGKKVLFPIPKHNKKDIEFFKKLLILGKYKPVIDRSYPLEKIVEAYKYVEKGQKTGNVVITVKHS